ncbi:MAG TPA: di-trans,poly-cis-decaprenylcistransferase [Rhodanobacteraceae bacterium]|nr:di-trans,poly-cis-decaprenylcistransferase [Rhodanobacteraceae bacterium]
MNSNRLHVAIIMDGNGRWAEERGWHRSRGHRAGAEAVRRTVEAAPDLGIATLTLYAFSADNWRRPPAEVAALMGLLRGFLESAVDACQRDGVRLAVIGRRDRIAPALVEMIEQAEQATSGGTVLDLRLAVDYSSRDAIAGAAALHRGPPPSREKFVALLARAQHGDPRTPDVDLLIRTGREQRLSDFLLWECAYAELLFSSVLWPDFSASDLAEALADFRQRERRFGRLAAADAAADPACARTG